MSKRATVDKCLAWISDEKLSHQGSDFGINQKAVQNELRNQERRVRIIQEYSSEVDSALSKNTDQTSQLRQAYADLRFLAEKRLGCLQSAAQVATLQDVFSSASVDLVTCAAKLASASQNEANNNQVNGSDPESTARSSQSCILAMKVNWQWISKMAKCNDTHLQHASLFHQFFHDVNEYKQWMPAALTKADKEFVQKVRDGTNVRDPNKFFYDVKSVLSVYLHWQYKLNELFDRSRTIFPLELRMHKLDYERPIITLCDYSTKEITIIEGEELTLVDSTHAQIWRVRNMRATEADVPSLICVIPPPDQNAVRTATSLRVSLLKYWTGSLQHVGVGVIDFLLSILREWSPEEEKLISALTGEEKDDVRNMISCIINHLEPFWLEWPPYCTLQKRIKLLQGLLDKDGDPTFREMAAQRGKALIIQPTTVNELLQRYKELWTNWETYKILVETSRHPELVLVSGNVDKLDFIDFAELLRKWHFKLDKDQLSTIDVEPEQQAVEEEVLEASDQTDSLASAAPPGDHVDRSVVTKESTTTAVAENYMASQQEEKRTFVITGVLDGRTKKIVSMTEAVKGGIINPSSGTYHNLATGESYPIPVAMNAGFIEVEYSTVTKGQEKRKDIGLLTVHTHKESRPYTVKGVLDAKNDIELTVDEALDRGIFKPASKSCLNTETGEEISLSDALDSGLLVVEFDKTAEVSEPEVVAITYAIHGVKDVKNGRLIQFSEAVRRRIINQESGCYVNNNTGEEIFIGDAIKSGLVKARVVKDPNQVDIAPENRMVFSKVQKSKIRAMAAFMKNGQS